MREKTVMPWALRDWTTCFLQCGFRLEEEELDTFCSPSAQVPNEKLVLHSNKRLHKNNTSGDHKKTSHTKESIQSSSRTRKHVPLQKERSFPDQDFIVFQFTKDGSIHVVNNNNNAKTEETACGYHAKKSSSRNIRTKIIFMEHGQKVYKSRYVGARKDNEGDSLIIDEANSEICLGEGKVKCDTKSETENGISKREKNDNENIKACDIVGAEQGETIQSDGSSSSFEFPELNWEEIESPKQFHTPDIIKQLIKHNAISHSCRF